MEIFVLWIIIAAGVTYQARLKIVAKLLLLVLVCICGYRTIVAIALSSLTKAHLTSIALKVSPSVSDIIQSVDPRWCIYGIPLHLSLELTMLLVISSFSAWQGLAGAENIIKIILFIVLFEKFARLPYSRFI